MWVFTRNLRIASALYFEAIQAPFIVIYQKEDDERIHGRGVVQHSNVYDTLENFRSQRPASVTPVYTLRSA